MIQALDMLVKLFAARLPPVFHLSSTKTETECITFPENPQALYNVGCSFFESLKHNFM